MDKPTHYKFNQTGSSIKTLLNLIMEKHCKYKRSEMSFLFSFRNYFKNSKEVVRPANKKFQRICF